MIYLLLNIVFGSSFILILKWVQVREREDSITVGCINYVTAAIATAPVVLAHSSPGDFDLTTSLLGSVNGTTYFIAFFFVIYMILWIGVASSTVVGSLSMLMPIGFGVVLWGEDPSLFQMVGVVLAIVSLSMIGDKPKHKKGELDPEPDKASSVSTTVRIAAIVIFFLLCGLSRLAQAAFRYMCEGERFELKMQFVLAAFVVASFPSIGVMIARGRKLLLMEVVFGVALGMANMLQVLFILEALNVFEGFIVFPVASAGGLMLTTLVATIVFGERLSIKTYIGISIATVALVLLNLKFES